MLKHLLFDPKATPRIALLIKSDAMNQEDLVKNYLVRLQAMGISASEVGVLSLHFNEKGKAPVKTVMEPHLNQIKHVLDHWKTTHVVVTDATYFKKIAKVRKAEPHYGYALPSMWEGITCAISVNYKQLIYNPLLEMKLDMGLQAIANHYLRGETNSFQNILQDVWYPRTLDEIRQAIRNLGQHPVLTCDIEATSLDLGEARTVSIAFAWDQSSGVAFPVRTEAVRGLLTAFFDTYDGKLIFHNAPYDTKVLIKELFMSDMEDYEGMLYGLERFYRDLEDTKIIAYLALNSTAGNSLGLKDLAFEYTGNYAIDDLSDVLSIPEDDLLTYNLIDACATWYVYDKYRPVVKAEQEDVYQNLFSPALIDITQMELVGMPLDPGEVESTAVYLEQVRQSHLDDIRNSSLVQLFEQFWRAETAMKATAKLKKKVKTSDDYEDKFFNPNSSGQLQKLLYEFLELPVLATTDTGQPSTDGKTIKDLITLLENQSD